MCPTLKPTWSRTCPAAAGVGWRMEGGGGDVQKPLRRLAKLLMRLYWIPRELLRPLVRCECQGRAQLVAKHNSLAHGVPVTFKCILRLHQNHPELFGAPGRALQSRAGGSTCISGVGLRSSASCAHACLFHFFACAPPPHHHWSGTAAHLQAANVVLFTHLGWH